MRRNEKEWEEINDVAISDGDDPHKRLPFLLIKDQLFRPKNEINQSSYNGDWVAGKTEPHLTMSIQDWSSESALGIGPHHGPTILAAIELYQEVLPPQICRQSDGERRRPWIVEWFLPKQHGPWTDAKLPHSTSPDVTITSRLIGFRCPPQLLNPTFPFWPS